MPPRELALLACHAVCPPAAAPTHGPVGAHLRGHGSLGLLTKARVHPPRGEGEPVVPGIPQVQKGTPACWLCIAAPIGWPKRTPQQVARYSPPKEPALFSTSLPKYQSDTTKQRNIIITMMVI